MSTSSSVSASTSASRVSVSLDLKLKRCETGRRVLEGIELKKTPPFFLDSSVTADTLRVCFSDDEEKRRPLEPWMYFVREVAGSRVKVSAVAYLEDLDGFAMTIGSKLYVGKRKEPFEKMNVRDTANETGELVKGPSEIYLLSYSAPSRLLVAFSERYVFCYRVMGARGDDFPLSGKILDRSDMEVRPTAVATSSCERIVFGDVFGRLHSLKLVFGEDRRPKAKLSRISGPRGASAVRSILFDEECRRMYVLHCASEISMFSLPGESEFIPEALKRGPSHLYTFYNKTVEVHSLTLMSKSTGFSGHVLLGVSEDGCCHWFDISTKKICGPVSNSAIGHLLLRERGAKISVLGYNEGRVFLALTVGEYQLGLQSSLIWARVFATAAGDFVLSIEKRLTVKGKVWNCWKLVPELPTSALTVPMGLRKPIDLLSRQWCCEWSCLKHHDYLVVTDEVIANPTLEAPREILYRIFKLDDKDALQRFIAVWGHEDTAAMLILMAVIEDEVGTNDEGFLRYVLETECLKEAAWVGFWIAFKRLMSPIWEAGLFQFHFPCLSRGIEDATYKRYRRSTASFLKVLGVFIKGLTEQHNNSSSEVGQEAVVLEAMLVLEETVAKCRQILLIGRLASKARILDSITLASHQKLRSALLIETKRHPGALVGPVNIWSLSDLMHLPYKDFPLVVLMEALVWRGHSFRSRDLSLFEKKAPDFYEQFRPR